MREEDMETKNPTVAVVMCTYNGEKYLREQMDSILAQTYPIHEIIVQDDRSTDGTVALLQNIAVCGRQRKATWQPYAYGLRNYRALLRLCLRHRAALLPPPPARARGWRGAIRGFFYPFIFAWHCSQFDME